MRRPLPLLRNFEIAEPSMEPTLSPGNYVVASRLKEPKRGQVVVFEDPRRSGFLLVKRIIGLPGETVSISDGTVMVDAHTFEEPTPGAGMWDVGSDEVFVLGDNRPHSDSDSRQLGPIGIAELMVVRMRYWPTVRWIRLPRTFSPR